MSKTITLREANQAFARCIREVEAGADYIITRNGIQLRVSLPLPAAASCLRDKRRL
jgi:antitoxin (DNA-binding transcriptional repressor) of toxin-antitoxin stability system